MAADTGDPVGMNYLGRIYQYGRGVEKNVNEALSWYQ
jgi:TPR repeat protein